MLLKRMKSTTLKKLKGTFKTSLQGLGVFIHSLSYLAFLARLAYEMTRIRILAGSIFFWSRYCTIFSNPLVIFILTKLQTIHTIDSKQHQKSNWLTTQLWTKLWNPESDQCSPRMQIKLLANIWSMAVILIKEASHKLIAPRWELIY